MATVQEQYAENVRQGQEAVFGAVDAWARTIQDAWGRLPVTDPAQAIDQFYGVTTRLLDVQRDMAKSLVGTTVSFAETVRNEARKAAEAVKPDGAQQDS